MNKSKQKQFEILKVLNECKNEPKKRTFLLDFDRILFKTTQKAKQLATYMYKIFQILRNNSTYIKYIIPDIDEKLDKRDLHLVKISDKGAGEEFGLLDIPCLVYFENGVPELFEGSN